MTNFESNNINNISSFATDTIYQIVTDRFFEYENHHAKNSEICDRNDIRKYHGGNWKGIIKKIQEGYFKKLGITALWISPPIDNIESLIYDGTIDNGKGGWVASYHGYYPRDYFEPNKFFGTWDDFKLLVKTAHDNDIKIIIDFVINHTSPTNDKERYEDGILMKEGKVLATYSNDKQGMFNHFGKMPLPYPTIEQKLYTNLCDLADLNQMNPTVDQYLRDSIKKWIDTGIDGIRVDAISHVPRGWINSWLLDIYQYKPLFIFGEYISLNDWFVDSNDLFLYNANRTALSFLNYPLANAIRGVFSHHGEIKLNYLVDTNEHQLTYSTINDKVNFIDNHDIPRFLGIDNNINHLRCALTIMMTSRGIPTIYYGTEQLMSGSYDPDNRKSIDWSKAKTDTFEFELISKLAHLRKESKALAYGTLNSIHSTHDVYIFERVFNNEVVIVAINGSPSKTYGFRDLKTSIVNNNLRAILNNGSEISVNGDKINLKLLPNACCVWLQKEENIKWLKIGTISPVRTTPNSIITIAGNGFGEKVGEVYFDKIKATDYLNWSDSLIQVIVPEGAQNERSIIKVFSADKTRDDSWYDKIRIFEKSQVPHRVILKNVQTHYRHSIYMLGNIAELGNDTRPVGPFLNHLIQNYPNWFLDINVPKNKKIMINFIMRNENYKPIKRSQTFELKIGDKIGETIFENIEWTNLEPTQKIIV